MFLRNYHNILPESKVNSDDQAKYQSPTGGLLLYNNSVIQNYNNKKNLKKLGHVLPNNELKCQ